MELFEWDCAGIGIMRWFDVNACGEGSGDPGADLRDVSGGKPIDQGFIDHGVEVMFGAKITIRVEGRHDQTIFASGEPVQSMGWDHEVGSWNEWGLGLMVMAGAFSGEDDTDAATGVGVEGLLNSWRKVEDIQAGIAFEHGRNDEGIRAPIDVAESTGSLDGSTDGIQS